MPRSPRVQYENAVYHVMARGNRREAIVLDDGDRELFLDTFAEACGRTGWEVFAWVLMDNHYHAVFRTPEPNLVAGMQWFQNAYTRRLNAKRRLWGHLFGGRYKAIPVEDEATSPRGSIVWRDYLRTVIDYVHLNPGRAGLVDGGKRSLLDFAWSSVAKGYALPPSRRPAWLAAEQVFDLYGEADTATGRRRFVERLDGFIRAERSDPEVDDLPLSKHFERGWYWGTQDFRERLLARLETMPVKRSRNYRSRSAGPSKDHGEKRASEILGEASRHFGMSVKELGEDRRGDWSRVSVAWALAKETSVPHAWIAERLNLKSAANASQQIRRFHLVPERELPKEVKQWKRSRNVA
jgi:REP element-mobilizing transposase RayT